MGACPRRKTAWRRCGSRSPRCRREVEAAQDQALRAQAEAENTRRRASRETENARKFALERFVSALLPAIDSFERAVEAAAAADAGQSVIEGIELSLKVLIGALEGAGVRVVDPAGEPFDPAFHEAVSMVTERDMEPGSVARVIQKGYVLNERLVRAAMVMVVQAPFRGAAGGSRGRHLPVGAGAGLGGGLKRAAAGQY